MGGDAEATRKKRWSGRAEGLGYQKPPHVPDSPIAPLLAFKTEIVLRLSLYAVFTTKSVP
jgi:hypothetical protein